MIDLLCRSKTKTPAYKKHQSLDHERVNLIPQHASDGDIDPGETGSMVGTEIRSGLLAMVPGFLFLWCRSVNLGSSVIPEVLQSRTCLAWRFPYSEYLCTFCCWPATGCARGEARWSPPRLFLEKLAGQGKKKMARTTEKQETGRGRKVQERATFRIGISDEE